LGLGFLEEERPQGWYRDYSDDGLKKKEEDENKKHPSTPNVFLYFVQREREREREIKAITT